VVGVSSLAAVAQDAADKLNVEFIAVAMDARMGEIYCASYQVIGGMVSLVDEERVCPPEQFSPHTDQKWCGVGTGWGVYEQVLSDNFADKLASISVEHFPQSSSIIKLAQVEIDAGRTVRADQAMPVYLRNNVAKKKGEQ
jgi:tRNA threonylcarbamoyladenosine biosynthesis protein TsaB